MFNSEKLYEFKITKSFRNVKLIFLKINILECQLQILAEWQILSGKDRKVAYFEGNYPYFQVVMLDQIVTYRPS